MGTDVAFIKNKIEEQEKKNRRDKKIVQRVEDVAEQYVASLFGGIWRMIAEFEEGIIVSKPREPVVDLSESELSETFSRMKEKIKNLVIPPEIINNIISEVDKEEEEEEDLKTQSEK